MSVLEAVASGFDYAEKKPAKPSRSLIADRILQDANHEYPLFAIAQAAHIAAFAQVEGIPPERLKQSLLADTKRMNKLVDEANYHRVPYIGTIQYEDEELSLMTTKQMEQVIIGNFDWAQMLATLHPEELEILTSRYNLYYEQAQKEPIEDVAQRYQEEAQYMLLSQPHLI